MVEPVLFERNVARLKAVVKNTTSSRATAILGGAWWKTTNSECLCGRDCITKLLLIEFRCLPLEGATVPSKYDSNKRVSHYLVQKSA